MLLNDFFNGGNEMIFLLRSITMVNYIGDYLVTELYLNFWDKALLVLKIFLHVLSAFIYDFYIYMHMWTKLLFSFLYYLYNI